MSTKGTHKFRSSIIGAAGISSLVALAVSGAQAGAAPGVSGAAARQLNLSAVAASAHQADALSVAEASAYSLERTAPALSVSGRAFAAAEAQAAALPEVGGRWTQLTNGPDSGQPKGYTDPVWSNAGAGFRNVGGRATALAADGSTLYAGFAEGGVWKSTDAGQHWKPIFDQEPTLSIGSLAINPADHSLWVGTGEANTNADSYAGQGVFRSSNGGASFSRVGGTELSGFTSYRIVFDGQGNVYDASNNGLWRRSASNTTRPGGLCSSPIRTRPTTRTRPRSSPTWSLSRERAERRSSPSMDGAGRATHRPTRRTTVFTSRPVNGPRGHSVKSA